MFKREISFLIENELCDNYNIPNVIVDAATYIINNVPETKLNFKTPNRADLETAYNTINIGDQYTFKDLNVAWHVILKFCKKFPRPFLANSLYDNCLSERKPEYPALLKIYLKTMERNDLTVLHYLMVLFKEVMNNQSTKTPRDFARSILESLKHKKRLNWNNKRFLDLIVYLINDFNACIQSTGDMTEAVIVEDNDYGSGVTRY